MGVPNTEVAPAVDILLAEPPNIDVDPEPAFLIDVGVLPNKDPEGELPTAVGDAAFVLPPNKEVEPCVVPPPNIKPCGFVVFQLKSEPVEAEPNVLEEFPPNIDAFVVVGVLPPKTVLVLLPPKTEVVDRVDGVDILPNTDVFEELLNGIGVDVIVALLKIFLTEDTDVVAGN